MTNNFFHKALMLAVIALFATAQSFAANYLKVTTADNASQTFALSEYPSVSVGASSLVINAGTQRVELPLSNVISFNITDEGSATGINNVKVADKTGLNPVFSFDNAVNGNGLEPGSRLAIYSIDGRLVGSAKVSENGTVSVPFNAEKGIFVVKGKGVLFKFIKK